MKSHFVYFSNDLINCSFFSIWATFFLCRFGFLFFLVRLDFCFRWVRLHFLQYPKKFSEWFMDARCLFRVHVSVISFRAKRTRPSRINELGCGSCYNASSLMKWTHSHQALVQRFHTPRNERKREREKEKNQRHFQECVADNQIKEAHYAVEWVCCRVPTIKIYLKYKERKMRVAQGLTTVADVVVHDDYDVVVV